MEVVIRNWILVTHSINIEDISKQELNYESRLERMKDTDDFLMDVSICRKKLVDRTNDVAQL